MKFLIVSFALAAVAAAQYQGYKEPAGGAKNARILAQAEEVNPDGSYAWSYETENGISAAENGAVKGVGSNGEPALVAEGGYQYTAPDGQVIAVKYIAGPDGFLPVGSHLPVAPPIPEAILRSLAWNAAHPQKDAPEYYKSESPKPYYAPSITPTPRPIYTSAFTTPKSFYPSVQPTFQPSYQPGFPQGFTPQTYFNPAGKR